MWEVRIRFALRVKGQGVTGLGGRGRGVRGVEGVRGNRLQLYVTVGG